VLAAVEGSDDAVRVERRGQADVDQVDRGVVVEAVDLGGRGEPELGGHPVQLRGSAAEHDHRLDVGMTVVDASVRHAESRPQQANPHGALLPGHRREELHGSIGACTTQP
jgi:hypothetical protein